MKDNKKLEHSEILELMKITKTRNKALSNIFKRQPPQISAAIHSYEEPTLRKKIIGYLERKLAKQQKKNFKKV